MLGNAHIRLRTIGQRQVVGPNTTHSANWSANLPLLQNKTMNRPFLQDLQVLQQSVNTRHAVGLFSEIPLSSTWHGMIPRSRSPVNLPFSGSEATNLPIEQTEVDLDPWELKGARAGTADLDGSVSVPDPPGGLQNHRVRFRETFSSSTIRCRGCVSGVETPPLYPLERARSKPPKVLWHRCDRATRAFQRIST